MPQLKQWAFSLTIVKRTAQIPGWVFFVTNCDHCSWEINSNEMCVIVDTDDGQFAFHENCYLEAAG